MPLLEGIPRWDTFEFSLRVRLLSVSLLHDVSAEQGVCVHKAQGIHASWVCTQLAEQCLLVILVTHVVAFEDNSAFELARWVAKLQFTILFHAYVKEATDMALSWDT